jgi:hypothetical protein
MFDFALTIMGFQSIASSGPARWGGPSAPMGMPGMTGMTGMTGTYDYLKC